MRLSSTRRRLGVAAFIVASLGLAALGVRAPAPDDCTTQVARNLDHAKFWALVVDALERIGDPA